MFRIVLLISFAVVAGYTQESCESRLFACEQTNLMLEQETTALIEERKSLQDSIDDLNERLTVEFQRNKELVEYNELLESLYNQTKTNEEYYHQRVKELERQLIDRPWDYLRYSGILANVAIIVLALWWLLPLMYASICMVGRGLSAVLNYIRTVPTRLWSSRMASAGEYIELGNFTPEAMQPGSELDPIKEGDYASCVFKIYKMDNVFRNQLSFIGHGFWSNVGETPANPRGLFLTASHNVASRTDILLMNANDNSKTLELTQEDWIHLEDYDVAYFVPTLRQTTTLGVTKAKAPVARLRNEVVVQAYGRSYRTMGILNAEGDSQYLNYDGSSIGGFSGSPYISNRIVYGMHLGSTQKKGMGIDLGFLNMKLRNRFRPEASEDWLRDEIEQTLTRKKKIAWKSYGLDDVIVKVKGQEVYFDKVDFDSLNSKYRQAFKEVTDFTKESYVDCDELPKNCQPPAPVLETGVNLVEGVQRSENPKLKKLYNLNGNTEPSTTGPQLTRAQSSEALEDMFKSMNVVLLKQSQLLEKIEKQLFHRSLEKQEKRGKNPRPKKI